RCIALGVGLATGSGIVVTMPGRTSGSEPPAAGETITLWPQGAPGAKGNDPDKDVPTLSVWRPRPEVATGSAVVVCPGGGYGMLAVDPEGKQGGEGVNSVGIAAFGLKYRVGPANPPTARLPAAR